MAEQWHHQFGMVCCSSYRPVHRSANTVVIDTFLYEKVEDGFNFEMCGIGQAGVPQETGRAKSFPLVAPTLFLVEKVIIPVNVDGNHWIFCVVDVVKRDITYLR
jgi:Ulp1 family protease